MNTVTTITRFTKLGQQLGFTRRNERTKLTGTEEQMIEELTVYHFTTVMDIDFSYDVLR